MSTHDRRWYLKPAHKGDDDTSPRSTVHETIVPLVERLAKRDGRRKLLRAWGSLYADEQPGSALEWFIRGDRKARHNVVSNAVDSVHARLSKAKPRPQAKSVGKRREAQRRGQKMTQWLECAFDQLRAYRRGSLALKDACVYGHGVLYPHTTYGKIDIDLVWVGDLIPDPREEREGIDACRTMYRLSWVDREILSETYPKKRKAIKSAKLLIEDEHAIDEQDSASDMVLVVEAWRLPTWDYDGNVVPGRHAIVCSSCTLRFDEYTRPYFPWAEMPFTAHSRKRFGTGLVASMAGIQSELNDITAKIADAYWLCAPSVWYRAGSVSFEQIGNTPWSGYAYTGDTPPVFNTPTGIHSDFVVREETLIRRAYELRGISQLSASAQKPAGLNSGKALTVHQDIESEHFLPQQESLEQDLYCELAVRLIDCAEDLCDRGLAENARMIGGGEVTDFTEARMKRGDYIVTMEPVSGLSRTTAGKLAELREMVELEVITDKDEVRELMQIPDLDRYNAERSAPRDLGRKLIDRALDGEDVVANPYMDLEWTRQHAELMLNLAELEYDEDEDDSGLDALRSLIGQIASLQKQAQQAATMAAAPAPGPMVGQGAPQQAPAMGGQPGPMGPEGMI